MIAILTLLGTACARECIDGCEGEGEGEGEGTPFDELCRRNYECQDEPDPAVRCAQDRADQDADERACSLACAPQSNLYAVCALETGECTEVDGTIYFLSYECEDEVNDLVDCSSDNC